MTSSWLLVLIRLSKQIGLISNRIETAISPKRRKISLVIERDGEVEPYSWIIRSIVGCYIVASRLEWLFSLMFWRLFVLIVGKLLFCWRLYSLLTWIAYSASNIRTWESFSQFYFFICDVNFVVVVVVDFFFHLAINAASVKVVKWT